MLLRGAARLVAERTQGSGNRPGAKMRQKKGPRAGASLVHCCPRRRERFQSQAYGPKIEPKRQLMPTLTVWMSGRLWLKQKAPPGTTLPLASVAVAQLKRFSLLSAMNMYSALMLQL